MNKVLLLANGRMSGRTLEVHGSVTPEPDTMTFTLPDGEKVTYVKEIGADAGDPYMIRYRCDAPKGQ